MKCQLHHMGALFIPIQNIDSKYLPAVKIIVGDMIKFNHYVISGPGGLILSHVTQDTVPDGEYDLPLTTKDFMEAYE